MMKAHPKQSALPTMLVCVLGGGFDHHGRLPSWVVDRLRTAIWLCTTVHLRAVCLLCGGQRNHDGTTEASLMRTWLLAHHFPSDRVMIEESSRDTLQNAALAKELANVDRTSWKVAVVTSGFHAERAYWIFTHIWGPDRPITMWSAGNKRIDPRQLQLRQRLEGYLTDSFFVHVAARTRPGDPRLASWVCGTAPSVALTAYWRAARTARLCVPPSLY